ncbi:hypothetical protein VNO77_09033 [Canavalia gladiata]|uniref:Uncharacterized protein n=1 Tax=Canavalia gladiata TaxID=3824 RepID=A0AAN9M9P9_CANGL
MHGKREEEEEKYIRKGPWKAEEDEVLLNHVNKYGPRDWSSIRSKGLLQRAGKSCRLRWVNKLRPNLKKWAKIASYLSGRTDNDVKNFWSSRQKRLARILQTSAKTPKSHKNKTKVPTFLDAPALEEAPKFSSSSEGEPSSSKPQSCSLPCIENSEVIKMVPLPDLIKYEVPSSDTSHVEQEFTLFDSYQSSEQNALPQFTELENNLTFSMGSQDLLARIDEPNFIEDFGPLEASEFGIDPRHAIGFPFLESSGSCRFGTKDTICNYKSSDHFFDDFPVDMFDDMEPPATPSKL